MVYLVCVFAGSVIGMLSMAFAVKRYYNVELKAKYRKAKERKGGDDG